MWPGYPSDGIVQVEEEEEAADEDSDDHDTYTIEEEAYTHRVRTPRSGRGSSARDGSGEASTVATAGSSPSPGRSSTGRPGAPRRQGGAPFQKRGG